ncbi:hypothetical protein CKJ90_32070, partial [Klebsiella pneumoniae]
GKVSPDAEPQIHDQAPGIARADAGGAFFIAGLRARAAAAAGEGKVSPDAEPQIHDQAPGIARADAGGAFFIAGL